MSRLPVCPSPHASDKPAALKQLNDYSNQQAQHMPKTMDTTRLPSYQKYNDMAIKPNTHRTICAHKNRECHHALAS